MIKKIVYIFSSIVSGILWRLGGSDIAPKAVRRYGVMGVMLGLSTYKTKNIFLGILSAGILFGFMTMGYGIPSIGDEGSLIGRFVVYTLGVNSEIWATLLTRMVISFGYSLAFIPTIIYTKKWVDLFKCLIVIIIIPLIALLNNAMIEEFLIGFIIIGVYCFLGGKHEINNR